MLFGNQLREQSAAHGAIQRANDAEEYGYGIDRIDRVSSVQRDEEQQRRAQSESGVTQNDEFAALEAVRNISRNEKKEDAGKKLRQTDETKIPWRPCDFVDLPANGDRLHLRRNDGAKASQ